ncbi:MAG: 5-formyltetrahydrofolate cyclo-ligase [Thermodesulfovibrionales bacterium]|nr:5-formyltetrahydrofolate cyclo-ligase [Thermodesulfovibrionales bacterium]
MGQYVPVCFPLIYHHSCELNWKKFLFHGIQLCMTAKEAIRKEVLKKRDSLKPEIRAEKDASIRERLFAMPEFVEAKLVLLYASFRSEADTLKILDGSLHMGKRIVLPKVDKENRRLVLHEIVGLPELFPGFMGIPEPLVMEGRMRGVDIADLVILPGVAFDPRGNRLGYGAGYYDILLSERTKKMPLVALAYEEQIVDCIPAEKHDVRIDMIITDQRLILT